MKNPTGASILSLFFLSFFFLVQSLRYVLLFATPWITARQASLSIKSSRSLLKFMSIELVMPFSHLILCCPLFLILLRHNWHTSLCRFKSFSAMVWFTYIVKWLPQSVEFSSVTQSCPTLCDPMNCSMPGLPVLHQLLKSTQTHVHWVGDAIQLSHPLSSPSPPALNLSQHQGLFKWVSSLHQVAKVLEFQLQHQSFQRTPRTDLL